MSKSELAAWKAQEPLYEANWWNKEIKIYNAAGDPEKASVVPLTGAMRIFPYARASFSVLPEPALALAPEPAPEPLREPEDLSTPSAPPVACVAKSPEPTLPDSFSQAAKHQVNPLHSYCHVLKWLEDSVFFGRTSPRFVRRAVQGAIWVYDRSFYPVVSRALGLVDTFHRPAPSVVAESPSYPSPC